MIRVLALLAVAALGGCADWDWRATGRRTLEGACRGMSNCSQPHPYDPGGWREGGSH
jgi:hypothetical protein